jgi:hypothetical protein
MDGGKTDPDYFLDLQNSGTHEPQYRVQEH